MTKPAAFSLRIFVADGDPDGLQIVERTNWNGKAVVFPRSLYPEVRTRDEFQQTGVYLLIGPEEGGDGEAIYIGEGDPVKPRLESHFANKEFWTRAIFFVAPGFLNKAHVQYLEAGLVSRAHAAKRVKLDNETKPTEPTLSEADRADMGVFLANVLGILPVLGVDAFDLTTTTPGPSAIPELTCSGRGATAKGRDTPQGFVVLRDSQAVTKEIKSLKDHFPIVSTLRVNLIASGVLAPDGATWKFTQDYVFNSPSLAAAVVMGSPSSGRVDWKDGAGRTLKQIQESQAQAHQTLMNEAETRAEHIDPALKAAGWGVVAASQVRREFPITPGRIEGGGKRGKALTADYVLFYRNTKLGVIEAKAYDIPASEGVAQAKNYAEKVKVRFTYATNGKGIYEIDMDTGVEREIDRYPTPEELWQRTFEKPDALRDSFADVPFEDKGGSHPARYFQDIAVQRVMDAVAARQKRILLTLATGTGKTFIAFQIAWKLFQARWSLRGEGQRRPRVLFLADRNILANQAYNAFSAFSEDAMVRIKPGDIKKKGSVPKNGSIFFTIFQTFMSGPPVEGQPAPYFGQYPPDFFDFIVIDECHRGGANDESNWRAIMEYFKPAVQLGLTATPKRLENADTYKYFGEPVYKYSLKDGINDGFLTPFRLKQITTTLDEYVYTPDDELVEGELESGRVYGEEDFNKIIEIKERERKRVEIFMSQIDQREKTLVFCATQEHAAAVRDLINQIKTSKDPNYCQRVTANDGELGEQHLRDFQDNEKTIPTILTTSQKLSTGVDARNIRNIVLMRPVKSMIEFKQIIGRGTRLYEGKDYFTIYDFVKAYQHFQDPEWDGEPLEPEPCPKCGSYPCVCEPTPTKLCDVCGKAPCLCPKDPCHDCGETPCVCDKKKRAKVKLADGKARTIQHMLVTTFWHQDGTPITAAQFLELLFGKLPEFFKDEEELRKLWSAPDTRAKLLQGLAEKGFGHNQLAEMQKIIDAEKSDLFDVLAYVAYAAETKTRAERAEQARTAIKKMFSDRQQEFIDFVLSHYVSVGVEELGQDKLNPLLKLKYHNAIADAVKDLGQPSEIKKVFDGFQRFLYQQVG